MALPIQTNKNNPILRQKAKKVNKITAEIKQLILNMIETLKANNGAGLAAPQVGQSLRIIVVKPESDMKTLVLINPEIKKTSRKKITMIEGCLSLPNLNIPVERPYKITVTGLDINGRPLKIKAKGILARVIQHEIEHLDGILICDQGRSLK